MKKLMLAAAGAALAAMLTGCTTITEGTVCDKRFTPEHTTVQIMHHRVGTVTTMIPRTVHHPDTWEICVSGIDDGEEKTQWKTVAKSEYDALSVGDWWEADE